MADGGSDAVDVHRVQPGEGVLQVDGYAVGEAGGQPQLSALGSLSELKTIMNIPCS